MSSDKTYSTIKNKANNTFSIAKTRHDSPLEFDVEIISTRVLAPFEVREVYKYLFNNNKYCKLQFDDTDDESMYLNCIFINPKRIEGGVGDGYGVVGFRAKVVCDAPWGWSEDIENKYEFKTSTDKSRSASYAMTVRYLDDEAKTAEFVIENNTDADEYIYPEVEFETVKESDISESNLLNHCSLSNCIACYYKTNCARGDIPCRASIVNLSDSSARSTCVFWNEDTDGNGVSMVLNMNGLNGTIRGVGADNVNRISNTNKTFVRLVPGENVFRVQNIKSITFKYKEARILV